MEASYKVADQPAGSSPLHIELYSEHHMEPNVHQDLTNYLKKALPHQKENCVLIIGGRCGVTAGILAPFCKQIDIVEEEPYVELLKNRFVDKKDIQYRFNKEGMIGEDHSWKSDINEHCKFDIYTLERFHKTEDSNRHYSLVLLQHVIVKENINVIRELMMVSHDVLVTMIVPGKLPQMALFKLLSGIEKNILTVFYENQFHERLRYIRHITGRREEHTYWEIFVWKKKASGEQNSSKDLEQIVELVEKEVDAHALVKEAPKLTGTDSYETPALVEMYRVFHFQNEEIFGVPNYPKICAEKSIQIAKEKGIKGRALDLGCAVGRTAIDLSEYFDEVIGVDISKAFIACADAHLEQKYQQCKTKVKFAVGDACKLDKSMGKFNLIFGGNLIDRLYDPKAFLEQVCEFVQPNGILLLASPYTWLEEYTPKDKWVGGIYSDGKAVSTQEGLAKMLLPAGFKQIKDNEDIRFVIKENQWVYQYTLANMTYWQKSA